MIFHRSDKCPQGNMEKAAVNIAEDEAHEDFLIPGKRHDMFVHMEQYIPSHLNGFLSRGHDLFQ